MVIAVSGRGKERHFLSGKRVTRRHVVNRLGQNAVGEERFVGETDVVHDDIAKGLRRRAQIANACRHRGLGRSAGSEGDLRGRRDVMNYLGHAATFVGHVGTGVVIQNYDRLSVAVEVSGPRQIA